MIVIKGVTAMSKNINTPYDDVGRTMMIDAKQMLIPVINELYGTAFTGQEHIELLQNENFFEDDEGDENRRVTDSFIKIVDEGNARFFQIELQSSEDGTILIRIFEYGSLIARRLSVLEGDTLTVTYPDSAIMALRSTQKTPDKMKIVIRVPGGKEVSYDVPVLKVQNYDIDEIFKKKLYFLIPFYIFRFEKELSNAQDNDEKLFALKQHYIDIMSRLEESCRSGMISEYEKLQLKNLSMEVIEAIALKYDRVQKGLGEIMGGKVLDYEAKDIYKRGLAEGLAEGEAKGATKGKFEGIREANNEVKAKIRDLQGQGISADEILKKLIESLSK